MAGRYVPGASAPYTHGSAARQLETQPLRRREEEIRRREQQERRVQPKRRVDKVSVVLTCITFAAVMIVGLFYLRLQFQSTYVNKSVVKLQNEVVNLEKENAVAELELNNQIDLTTVYEKATKGLGMRQPTKGQVFTYTSKKSTQVRQHSEIMGQ